MSPSFLVYLLPSQAIDFRLHLAFFIENPLLCLYYFAIEKSMEQFVMNFDGLFDQKNPVVMVRIRNQLIALLFEKISMGCCRFEPNYVDLVLQSLLLFFVFASPSLPTARILLLLFLFNRLVLID
jgi:hypothetical protein